MIDRRSIFRRRTLLEGRIQISRLNGWAAGCTIRDLSEAGARIAIHDGVVVPPSFELSVTGEEPQAVRMVWYRDGQAGVTSAQRPPVPSAAEATADLDSAGGSA